MNTDRFLYYFARVIALLIAIPIHESSHALCALALGDDTAEKRHRISMNPMRHFEPLGALSMILIGVGWAKPVPINPTKFKNRKAGMAVSSLAGPMSNLLISYACYTIYKISAYAYNYTHSPVWNVVFTLFFYVAYINASLAVFNMLPIPPFDGSRIFFSFLPEKLYWGVMKYERYIMIGLFALLYMGVFDGLLSYLINGLISVESAATGYIDLLVKRII